MLRISAIILLLIIGTVTVAPVHSQSNDFLVDNRVSDPANFPENLQSLIDYFDAKGVDIRPYLEDSRFELYEGITERFTKSAERKTPTIDDYKRILGFDAKKGNIKGFIDSNMDQLILAEQEYGIPRYVIAAIIGVESDFGKNIGRYNPLNAYVSMYAENYRAEFARAQLEELLEFTDRHGLDVFELKSSYAGAMTFAQFIPYSLNRWWVGSELFNMDNNILSVANYLSHFKEVTGSVERAVFRYNPSQLYTDAVLALAAEAESFYN
jgi:membrane-bound lytic murein transglycosylase B